MNLILPVGTAEGRWPEGGAPWEPAGADTGRRPPRDNRPGSVLSTVSWLLFFISFIMRLLYLPAFCVLTAGLFDSFDYLNLIRIFSATWAWLDFGKERTELLTCKIFFAKRAKFRKYTSISVSFCPVIPIAMSQSSYLLDLRIYFYFDSELVFVKHRFIQTKIEISGGAF